MQIVEDLGNAGRETGSERGHFVVFGQVVDIYIDDAYIKDGIVDTGYVSHAWGIWITSREPDTMFTLNRLIVAERRHVFGTAEKWEEHTLEDPRSPT